MRKLSLALVFFFWIWKLAQLSTASQDWITLRGCYDYKNETGSIVPFNEPQSCFDRCPNSTAVGLKNSTCICYQSYTYSGLRRDTLCNVTCPGKPWLYCGAVSGSNVINVYSKDPPQTNDINENTDYGFVSVSISQSGKQNYYTSKNNSTSRNGFICYDDTQGSDKCHRFDKNPNYTWEKASETCHLNGQVLIAFSNILHCGGRALYGGVFWIGLYRNSHGSVSPETTTSTSPTSTSTDPTTSTSTKSTTSFTSTLTPATTTKYETVSLLEHAWTSSVTGTGTTSEGSSGDGIKALYVAVSVVAAVLAAIVFALVSWKRKFFCFKPHHNSIGEVKQTINNGVEPNGLAHDIEIGKSLNEEHSNKVPLQGDDDNIIPAQEGCIQIVGIEPGVLKEDASLTNECKYDDNETDRKRKKSKTRHRDRKEKHKRRHKKKYKMEGLWQANAEIENSCEDRDMHADMNNKGQFDTAGICKLDPHTESLENQGDRKERHKKKNRKYKKRSHETDLVKETEGVYYITVDPVGKSDRYTEDNLGAASMNIILQKAENEDELKHDRRKHKRKKKRREIKTSKNNNYDDDNKNPGNDEINAE